MVEKKRPENVDLAASTKQFSANEMNEVPMECWSPYSHLTLKFPLSVRGGLLDYFYFFHVEYIINE